MAYCKLDLPFSDISKAVTASFAVRVNIAFTERFLKSIR